MSLEAAIVELTIAVNALRETLAQPPAQAPAPVQEPPAPAPSQPTAEDVAAMRAKASKAMADLVETRGRVAVQAALKKVGLSKWSEACAMEHYVALLEAING